MAARPDGPAQGVDAIALAQRLIRHPSITPDAGGCLDALQDVLTGLGFACTRLPFATTGTPDVDNLFARWDSAPAGDTGLAPHGAPGRHFCFAGHLDVVPPGDTAAWTHDPFAGAIIDDVLHGRGAADMKGAVAAFVAGFDRWRSARASDAPPACVSLLITGDEEGPAVNGTDRVLDWMAAHDQSPDACLVGEPTNPHHMGEMIKIGRRGSLNAWLTVHGRQGHIAYPHLADNPVHRLLCMLQAVLESPLDEGSAHFQASSLQVATIDVGNAATNVIPAA
ncbi:MAG: succinyl-diaminopimelate desuccinylase, partial [Alphaproteobacteria bacterium]